MAIKPKYGNKNVTNRPFVGRENYIHAFESFIAKPIQNAPQVLVYYGVGGIGKTGLRKTLAGLIKDPKHLLAQLDFKTPSYCQADEALFQLRRDFSRDYKIQFPTFELAYAVYWEKTHPQITLTKESLFNFENSELLTAIVSVVEEIPLISLLNAIPRVIEKAGNYLKEWWLKVGNQELTQLDSMAAWEIMDRLPKYWALDFNTFLENNSRSAIIIFDDYQSLIDERRTEGTVLKVDEWVRELIANLPQVFWVICGREKLEWTKENQEWGNHLTQCLIDSLAPDQMESFLQACGIKNPEIQKIILEGSNGVPYYLHLSVDTYYQIIKERKPEPEDFGKTPHEIFINFSRHLHQEEIETLKVLSALNFIDEPLFEILVKQFQTGYPLTAFSQLCRFSFLQQDTQSKKWYLHDLMRKSLQENQDQALNKKVHIFLFKHFDRQLENLDFKSISEAEINALQEGFYYGAEDTDGFLNWFYEKVTLFYNGILWKPLILLIEKLIQKLPPDHPEYPELFNKLALINEREGNFNKAEKLFIKALESSKNISKYICYLNNLAVLYRSLSRNNEAEKLYKQTFIFMDKLDIPPNNYYRTLCMINLAQLYRAQGNYRKAESLSKQGLSIFKQILPSDHPDLASPLNNLAAIYHCMGKYKQAEKLFGKALSILKKHFKSHHPNVITTSNNLAGIYFLQGKYSDAEVILLDSLKIMEQEKIFDPLESARLMQDLATNYRMQCKYQSAEKYCILGLEIRRNNFHPKHPDIAKSLHNLAEIYSSQGRFNEAEPLYQEALSINKEVLSPYHPDLAYNLNDFAVFYTKIGKSDKAKTLLEESLLIAEKSLESDHPFFKTIKNNMNKLTQRQLKHSNRINSPKTNQPPAIFLR